MFDAASPGEEPRAVIRITLRYDGTMETELQSDPGDEAVMANALRIAADDIAAEPTQPSARH